jgi:hypothetical protein
MSCPYYNEDCPKCNKNDMSIHAACLCIKPCGCPNGPITKTPLEQFNEEVKGDLSILLLGIKSTENDNPHGWWETSVGAEFGERKEKELHDFIIQKLTVHKELILKMVREKMPIIDRGDGRYCQECEDFIDGGNSCMCLVFNKRMQEFLNNLDTL